MTRKTNPVRNIVGGAQIELTPPGQHPQIQIPKRITDDLAAAVGHHLVGWGHFQHDLEGFTKNLMAQNGVSDIPRTMGLRRTLEAFNDAVGETFADSLVLFEIAQSIRVAANEQKTLRHGLGVQSRHLVDRIDDESIRF